MKKQAIYAMALSAILASSCSSDNVTADGNGNNAKGNAYVALNISLPTTSGSTGRADVGPHSYDQGTADEYNVNDLTVVYFKGTNNNETVAKTFKYKSNELTWSTPPTSASGITTQATLPVEEVTSDITKVLILINNGYDTKTVITKLTENTTWSEIQATKLTDKNNAEDLTSTSTDTSTDTSTGTSKTKNNFFMANSPLSDGTLLVNVTPQATQAEARAQAKTVYVERAVGKVSLSQSTDNWNNWTYTIPSSSSTSSYKNDEIEVKEWCLDITNRAQYAIRSYDTSWNDLKSLVKSNQLTRFIDTDTNHKLTGNNGDAYRTHWAKSPQYDTNNAGVTYIANDVSYSSSNGEKGYNYVGSGQTTITDVGLDKPAYCFENTFPTKYMKQGNTTRVLIKAKYTPKSNFATGVSSVDQDGTWYTIGNSGLVYDSNGLVALVKAALNETNVTIETSAFTAGKHALTKASFKVGTVSKELKDTQLATLQKTLGEVTTYKEGICFYVARIKHFGDYYTPWVDANYLTETDGNTRDYLGRYGIVRNNWYKMTVNSFSAPGDPTVPTIPEESDDVTKSYLQTTVEIMDWAVRNNSINF